jgi:hypothetical protein
MDIIEGIRGYCVERGLDDINELIGSLKIVNSS